MGSALTIDDLKIRLEAVRARLEEAARKSGRSMKDITLVAVTKGTKTDLIRQAKEAGLVICGENRVQEAGEKIPAFVCAPVCLTTTGSTLTLKSCSGLIGLEINTFIVMY